MANLPTPIEHLPNSKSILGEILENVCDLGNCIGFVWPYLLRSFRCLVRLDLASAPLSDHDIAPAPAACLDLALLVAADNVLALDADLLRSKIHVQKT